MGNSSRGRGVCARHCDAEGGHGSDARCAGRGNAELKGRYGAREKETPGALLAHSSPFVCTLGVRNIGMLMGAVESGAEAGGGRRGESAADRVRVLAMHRAPVPRACSCSCEHIRADWGAMQRTASCDGSVRTIRMAFKA